jgi:hypothetical protein
MLHGLETSSHMCGLSARRPVKLQPVLETSSDHFLLEDTKAAVVCACIFLLVLVARGPMKLKPVLVASFHICLLEDL